MIESKLEGDPESKQIQDYNSQINLILNKSPEFQGLIEY